MSKSDANLKGLKDMLYQKVDTNEDITKIRQSIEKCEKKALLSWTDESGYDILHHAVLSNNIEAVGIIFALGLFKPPHEPKNHPYLHVACNLGNKAITSMLLQERPRDNKMTSFQWVSPPKVGPINKGDTTNVTPLDVAGDSGHIGCVTTVLDFFSKGNKVVSEPDNNLCRACKNNSPSALRLLLTQKPPEDDVKAAVGCALKLANAECLDVLLRCNPRLTSLFRGMNLYHVLFSYSLSFKKEWYESLLTVTTVLLKHKQNPMCSVPFCTYPLYSLLSHTPASDFGRSFPYIIACLVLLLNAGVDPNFNEVAFEEQNSSHNIQSAFGRSSYASSFHCLFDTIEQFTKQYEDEEMNIKRYMTKCVDTLIKHAADPNIYGPIGEEGLHGNALHAFMHVVLLVGFDSKMMTVFDKLVQTGADVNGCPSEKYPINVLCSKVLNTAGAFEKIPKTGVNEFTENFKEMITVILDRMKYSAVQQACKVEFDGKPVSELQKKLFKYLKDEMNKRASQIWTLKQICRTEILQYCQRKTDFVLTLPIPGSMKCFLVGTEMKISGKK